MCDLSLNQFKISHPQTENLQAHLDWWCRTALSWSCAMGMRCRRRAVRASCLFKETRPSSARRFVSRNSLEIVTTTLARPPTVTGKSPRAIFQGPHLSLALGVDSFTFWTRLNWTLAVPLPFSDLYSGALWALLNVEVINACLYSVCAYYGVVHSKRQGQTPR